MNDLERRLSTLLDRAVGDPPRDVELVEVRRRAQRQRQGLAAVAVGTTLLVLAAVALPLLFFDRSGGPVSMTGPTSPTSVRTPATTRPPSTAPTSTALPFTVVRRIPVATPMQRLVVADGAVFGLAADGSSLTRIDPTNGRVGPQLHLDRAAGLVAGGGLVWVVDRARPSGGGVAERPAVLGLDPATLHVVRTVALTAPAFDAGYAGGLVWVAGLDFLTAVDPASGLVRHTVPVPSQGASNGVPIGIGASPDGTTLWTTEPRYAGGPVPVQLRDPGSGAVLASMSGAGDSVAGAGIAAADDHAWLFYGTGMLGTYTRVDRHGDRLVAEPPAAGEGGSTYTNGVTAHLIGNRLWVFDGESVGVVDDGTGLPLARAPFVTGGEPGVAALPSGRLAISRDNAVFVVEPGRLIPPP